MVAVVPEDLFNKCVEHEEEDEESARGSNDSHSTAAAVLFNGESSSSGNNNNALFKPAPSPNCSDMNDDNNNPSCLNKTSSSQQQGIMDVEEEVNDGVISEESLVHHHHEVSSTQSPIYKEVVIVGNGPSGIILSYFLAGNWPYYNGQGEEINEMLHYRLLSSTEAAGGLDNVSLVEQDLSFISQSLEGRSSNPVALLFDILNHPQADLGLELPSLLTWKHNSNRAIDHVVLGRGPPGGAWQSMDGNVLTISLGCWMELPEMNFRDWEAKQEARCVRESRATVASVAQYYCDYVEAHNLQQYFRDYSVTTEVTLCSNKCLPKNCDNLPTDISSSEEDRNFRRHTISEIPVGKTVRKRNRPLYNVKGLTLNRATNTLEPFNYLTRNLVLATGASDLPNILNVEGESLPFVLHSLHELEHLIVSGKLNPNSDPILVVGAGLSAADAIIAARFHSIPVIHVFRRSVEDKNLIFRQLPGNMYPEYHKVFQMMQYPAGYEGYKVYEQHVVIEILPDRRVKLAGPTSCGVMKISNVVISIGSHPNLSFLRRIEHNIGLHPGMPIDCKRNPVAVNFDTHESVRQPGLYALGPLVGENFVRFLQGGALAITNHLVKRRQSKH